MDFPKFATMKNRVLQTMAISIPISIIYTALAQADLFESYQNKLRILLP